MINQRPHDLDKRRLVTSLHAGNIAALVLNHEKTKDVPTKLLTRLMKVNILSCKLRLMLFIKSTEIKLTDLFDLFHCFRLVIFATC